MGGRVPDDDSSPVVLDRTRKNLTGTGAELARHHDQRPIPHSAAAVIGVLLDGAVGVLDLDHRSAVDEQAGQVDRLREATPSIFREIDHYPFDPLAFEFLEQSPHVAGAAAEVNCVLLGLLHVEIEARQVDVPDLHWGRGVG